MTSSCFLILHTPLFSSNVLITEYERDLDRLKALAVRLDILDLHKHHHHQHIASAATVHALQVDEF